MDNIVYVGNFETNSIGEPEIAKCLEREGYTVHYLQEKKTDIDEILSIIEQYNCKFLLYAKFRIKNTPNEIRDFLQELKIPAIVWIFDLYFGM